MLALTPLQESMVLASVRAPRSGAYIIQGVCKTPEALDANLLRRAWQSVAQRHAGLRTSIKTDTEGRFWQQVSPSVVFRWEELDWTGIPESETPARLEAFLALDRERGFRFDEGVPLRFTLIRPSTHSSILIWSWHHVLLDGRGWVVVWKEWFAFYEASLRGEELPLPEALPFSDHLAWLDRQDWQAAERYWRQQLAGLTETTGFVKDRVIPAGRETGYGREGVKASLEFTRALEGFARQHNLTVNTLVQAAWALLLSRYSGRREVIFGVTRACRRSSMPGAPGSIGLFINILPLRVSVPLDAPLLTWLEKVRAQWTSMAEHEHTPIDRIREASGLPAGVPLFDTMVNYLHERSIETLRKLSSSWAQRDLTAVQRTDSALTLAAFGGPVLSFEIVYDKRLFGREMMAAMAGHLRTLLESFIAQPQSPVGALKMLTPREEALFLPQLTSTPPAAVCAHELIERQAAITPDNSALDSPNGSVSYRQMNEQANRLARCLRARGAQPEDLIAVAMERSPEAIIAILAVLKSGAAFLPLDSALPHERLAQMMETARPKFSIRSLEEFREEMASQSAVDLPTVATPGNAAYAIFTSGSTGQPKAVVVTHRSLVNHTLAAARVYGISETDRRLQFASMGTDVLVAEIFNYLSCGAALVFGLVRQGTSAGSFLRFLEEQRITITGIPSTWWAEVVAALSEARMTLPPSLRAVIAGMERVDPAVFQKWKRVAGNRVRWFNAYGPTETTATATIYEAGSSEYEGGTYVPIGKPLANVTAYVLDDAMSPLPAGVVGELYIGGEGVARGYLDAPDLTAERFVANPFHSDNNHRLYRTGDLAFYLPDGNLVFAGRRDRQIKIRGHRIELEEIEAVLERHEAVELCAVIVQNREGHDRLVAYLTARGEAAGREELSAHLSRHLPDHMIPAAFIHLAEMPLTQSGKIDRLALSRHEPELPAAGPAFQEPSSPVEKRVAELWREVLGVDRVGATDNFFELGGDSLRATRLITRIQAIFGRELDMAVLLRAPTVARLAAILSESVAGPPGNILPLQASGSRTPFYCISDSLIYRNLIRNLGRDQPFFTVRGIPLAEMRPPYRLEDIAAESVARLRAFQPEGPYLLGGWCRGGVIAYEMARQLRAQGESVPLLVLFDSFTPLAARHWSLKTLSAKVGFHAGVLRSLSAGKRSAYISGRTRSLIAILRSGIWRITHRLNGASGSRPPAGPIDQKRIEILSLIEYRPQPYTGHVLLFRGANQSKTRYMDPKYGWGELVKDLEVFNLAGDHRQIFEEPAVTMIARELEARFAAALDSQAAHATRT